MTPAPKLQELIDVVTQDAPSDQTLDQLATASETVAQLEQVGDSLLGHFVDQCRRDGHSWSEISHALGVSKQAAHKRFSFATPTLERFTQRARNTLAAARNEAAAMRHGYIGTEHLLLGLFSEPGGLAALALAEHGIERPAVEARILEITPRGSANPSDAPPYTPRAVEALAGAVTEALGLGHNYIGTEHLLLALFRDESGLAARVLTELGLDGDAVRAGLVAALAEMQQAKFGLPTQPERTDD